MKPIYKLIISLLIPLLVGAVSAYFTTSSVDTWYQTINKPSFNPPNYIFAPVWTVLYILMGIALFLVWNSRAEKVVKSNAIYLFGFQLLLNFLWSFIFFNQHHFLGALIDIILLWIVIVLTIKSFGKIKPQAAWLMLPYLLWVSFAIVLTYSVWRLNS